MADTPDAPPRAEPGSGRGPRLTRGQFLTAGTLGVGGLMGALIGAPITGMALAPAVRSRAFESVEIGLVDEFKPGEYTKVVLQPGEGRESYVRRLVAFVRANDKRDDDPLAPDDQWEFTIISNRCAHLGCPVQNAASGFVCPCHGGAYDTNGRRTGGPPVRPLDRYEWRREGDRLIAVDEYSLTQDGRRVSLRGPGQHTGGPEGLLYPLQP